MRKLFFAVNGPQMAKNLPLEQAVTDALLATTKIKTIGGNH